MILTNLQIILTVIILFINFILEGINNSLITARKGFDGFKWNEHIIFVLQRGCWILMFFVLLPIKDAKVLSIIFILSFSFFHNGAYGESMKKLGFKQHSWKYSKRGTNWIEINLEKRIFLLILAVIILITTLLTNK